MKKKIISLLKAFITIQEDREDKETFEDDWINVNGLMTLMNDSSDGDLNMCDADIS